MTKTLPKLESDLTKTDWHSLLMNRKCSDQYSIFHDHVMSCSDEHAPKHIVKLKSKQQSDPWLTTGILKSICKQKELY